MDSNLLLGIVIVAAAIGLAGLGLALRNRRITREAGSGNASANATPAAAMPATPPPPAPMTPVAPMAPEPSAPTLAMEQPPAPAPPPPAPTAPPPPPVHAPPPPAPAHAAAPGDESVEVLRVLRLKETGKLLVEMEGQRYRAVEEIKDQKQGLSLVDAVMDLQQFLGVDIVTSIAASEALEPPKAPPGSSLPPLQKPSLNPIKQMMILRDRDLKKAREKREAGPQPTSIVEEIEAILVKRLVGSPFEGRSIHMRPGLHGGAHIDVDGRGYESIEDVADLEVKDFLKTVIAAWETGER